MSQCGIDIIDRHQIGDAAVEAFAEIDNFIGLRHDDRALVALAADNTEIVAVTNALHA